MSALAKNLTKNPADNHKLKTLTFFVRFTINKRNRCPFCDWQDLMMQNLMRSSVILGTAAVAIVGVTASLSQAAAFTDDFESPKLTSGTNATLTANNGWASGAASNAYVYADTTTPAYSGSQYLRLVDNDTSVTSSATNTFATPVAANGAAISFALRDQTFTDSNSVVNFNNDQVVIKSGSSIALQLGIVRGTGTKTTITATPYVGVTAQTAVQTNISVKANEWYLFSITYGISGTAGTYSLTITDPGNSAFVPYSTTINGQTALSGTAANLTSMVLQTSASGEGAADIDAISVTVPEPAVGVGLLAGTLLLRRRRR